ncbi:MAG: WbqC family protein [Actinobacteria bacterium]|nr:MAG: WbqC family protein [Actinomycetota bacterium]
MKVAAIHQPQYLPYLGFFHKVNHADVFVVMDGVQFQLLIDRNDAWQRRHLTALRLNYARSPFFERYWDPLEDLLDRPWQRLVDLNVATTRWSMDAMGISTPSTLMSSLDVDGAASELLVNICRAIGADRYISGTGGKRYMDLDLFAAAGIEVLWQEFESPLYAQPFPRVGFVPDLSVVDALFSCGPDVKAFLE